MRKVYKNIIVIIQLAMEAGVYKWKKNVLSMQIPRMSYSANGYSRV